jgi:hypothetical protein
MRRSTAAVATSDNAVLAAGEWGFETDTHKLKIGDGVTAWVSLPYSVVPNPTGTFAPPGGVTLVAGDVRPEHEHRGGTATDRHLQHVAAPVRL